MAGIHGVVERPMRLVTIVPFAALLIEICCAPCRVNVQKNRIPSCVEREAMRQASQWVHENAVMLEMTGKTHLEPLKWDPDEVAMEWLDSLCTYPDTTQVVYQRWWDSGSRWQWFSSDGPFLRKGWSTSFRLHFEFDAKPRLLSATVYDTDGAKVSEYIVRQVFE